MTITAPREHGSHVITVIETAWAAIRALHPEVPRVVTITGRGDYADITWGHFAAGVWNAGQQEVSELFISGELIALGGRRVMQTLLHEAAHGLAHVRGIKDTSNKFRYHNLRFVQLATALGLTKPAEKDKVIGWSACLITDATAERYKDMIAVLDAEGLPYRRSAYVAYLRKWGEDDEVGGGQGSGLDGDDEAGLPGVLVGVDQDDAGKPPLKPVIAPAGRDGVRISIGCACVPPRMMSCSPGSFERGPVECGTCSTNFVQVPARPRRRRTPRER